MSKREQTLARRVREVRGNYLRPTEPRADGPLPEFRVSSRSRSQPRRVIAKVEHHVGELFPRVGFIVTTLTGSNRAVVRFYNQRGTAEQWIKLKRTRFLWTPSGLR